MSVARHVVLFWPLWSFTGLQVWRRVAVGQVLQFSLPFMPLTTPFMISAEVYPAIGVPCRLQRRPIALCIAPD
ncbi:hypothetical protein IWX46DRAFT_616550 [Phyllosticta citricarpa]|uniref:Uncharacterized protein n=1 Tax=Phyllosticta citricarpa TaxID=55181 RepID=A0ABR1L4E2_9PEZI